MRIAKLTALVALLLLPSLAGAGEGTLTPEQLRRMIGWTSYEGAPVGSVEISKQERFTMVDGEVATLIVATSEELSHAEENQLILYRQGMRRVVSLQAGIVGFTVLDLDGNGVSEIEVQGGFMQYGETTDSTSLVQISGWEMRTLREFEMAYDNSANCGEDLGPCQSTEVAVEYRDLNADGVKDIVETVKTSKDGEADATVVRKFLFRGDRVEPFAGGEAGADGGPRAVQLIVVTDPRCGEACDLVATFKTLRELFPELTVTIYNWGADPEAKELMGKVGAKTLPIMVFGNNFDPASEGAQKLARWLDTKGKYQMLRVKAEFDPTAEICDNGQDDTGDGSIDCADPTCRETLACRPEEPGRLDVFVMSDCPYALQGLDAMKSVLGTISKDVEFGIHFIAEKTADGFASMHGQGEVEEDIRRLCVIKHYPKARKYLSYIWCRNQLGNDGDWRECTGGNGIDPETVAACADGGEGAALLTADIGIAKALKVTASPTWLLNNHTFFNAITADAILENFCSENTNAAGCRKARAGAKTKPAPAPASQSPSAAPSKKPKKVSDPGFR